MNVIEEQYFVIGSVDRGRLNIFLVFPSLAQLSAPNSVRPKQQTFPQSCVSGYCFTPAPTLPVTTPVRFVQRVNPHSELQSAGILFTVCGVGAGNWTPFVPYSDLKLLVIVPAVV